MTELSPRQHRERMIRIEEHGQELLRLVERVLAIREPNVKWTALETARSWAAWVDEARTLIAKLNR